MLGAVPSSMGILLVRMYGQHGFLYDPALYLSPRRNWKKRPGLAPKGLRETIYAELSRLLRFR